MKATGVFAWLAMTLASASAGATSITIDPDDFLPGTDFTTASAYVSLTDGARNHVVASSFSCGGQAAPTGNAVFGLSSGPSCGGWASQSGGPYPLPIFGYAFVAAFASAVDSVSIAALNFGYTPPFSAQFAAYDENFQRIGGGLVTAPFGEPITISFAGSNIRYFEVGGQDSIAALALDRLTFNIPEPGTAVLALGALGLLGLSRVRRKPPRGIAYWR